jgi:hypothetical protein
MSRLSVGLLVGVVAVLGCGSSAKPPAAKTCTLNSECNNPLSCIFGRCHAACAQSSDCQPGQRCVKIATGSICQLDEEKRCPPGSACQTPLICAIDLQCHNNCTTAAECTPNQVCASGACAEKSEVGPDGKLVPATPVADAGPGVDAGGGADAGVDVPPTMAIGPCGVPETEPNDTRDTPVALTAPTMFTACIGTPKDADYYELTTPSDPGGGYFEFSITQVGAFEPGVVMYSVSDKGKITEIYADSEGQDLNGFLAAAAGEKYWLVVSAFAGANTGPEKYTLKVNFTKAADAYEPNDTKETAKPITLGTPIMALMHQGYRSGSITIDDIVDWYTTTVAAGNVTVKVENVPMDLEADIFVFDSTGKMERSYSPNDGANAMLTVMDVAAGPIYVKVMPFFISAPNDYAARIKPPITLPDHFTRQYKLTVSQ